MSSLSLDLSQDETTLAVGANGDGVELTAEQVDSLIRRLAEHRARMKPVHPAEPPLEERLQAGEERRQRE